MGHETPPHWDRSIRDRLLSGEAAALAEVYDRFAPLAFGIAQRAFDGAPAGPADEAASQVTGDVLGHLWQHPEAYDPARGPLRSWIAAEAHRRAVDLLRERLRAALPKPQPEQPPGERPAERPQTTAPDGAAPPLPDERVRAAATAARADYIVSAMPEPLLRALELTHFECHDYRLAAQRLGISGAEARRRLRLALQLLATAAEYPAGTGAAAGGER
ncbi:sigma factor [Streptomyces sp. 7-21]|uniref:sigma factor n=1 Tax=Streptomyces sp. 7-21 TaxID=2802283 RepID=UPI00191CB794|nr:sigma factor [Streptomyces sp. 7-21]MBL1067487.1 RNA polymerase subunit sigma-70 [Streptomyces sp. 7-21]